MSKWGFWEWLTYSTLFVAALVMAVIQGVKDNAVPTWMPGFLTSTNWNYVPLALMIIGFVAFGVKALGFAKEPKIAVLDPNPTSSSAVRRVRAAPQVNWEIWKRMRTYRLEQCACILAKDDPQYGPVSSQAKSFLELIIQESDAGAMKLSHRIESDYGNWTSPLSEVARTQFIGWADKQGLPVGHIK